MYEPDSDDKINGDFGMSKHDDNRNNDNEEHIPRERGWPIKKTKKNKPSSLTVKEISLKVTHTKEPNKEDKYETMDTICNKEE